MWRGEHVRHDSPFHTDSANSIDTRFIKARRAQHPLGRAPHLILTLHCTTLAAHSLCFQFALLTFVCECCNCATSRTRIPPSPSMPFKNLSQSARIFYSLERKIFSYSIIFVFVCVNMSHLLLRWRADLPSCCRCRRCGRRSRAV